MRKGGDGAVWRATVTLSGREAGTVSNANVIGRCLALFASLVFAATANAQVSPPIEQCLARPFKRVVEGTVLALNAQTLSVTLRIDRVLAGTFQGKSLSYRPLAINDGCPSLDASRMVRGQKIVVYFIKGGYPEMSLTPDTVFRFDRKLAHFFPDVKLAQDAAYRREAKPYGGAIPRGDPGNWISAHDYPMTPRHEGIEGLVRARLTVAPDGVLIGCDIVQSTGNGELDAATCQALAKRARYRPPPEKVSVMFEHRWQLPDRDRRPPGATPAPSSP